jgi:indolepyruvate ferredoxin oxidoreductase
VVDPAWAESMTLERSSEPKIKPEPSPQARALLEEVEAEGELKRLLEIRVPELIAYQDTAYARQYVEFVRRVSGVEQAAAPGQTRLSEAVARYLFKLMAYKDEYEVARLHLRPELSRTLADQFGEEARIAYQLHPPFLRYMGMKQKVSFGPWFKPGLQLLAAMRRLRGTPFDVFGQTAVRRLERALIVEYRNLIEQVLADLTPETYERAVKLANLPDLIRGYEEVKLKNVARYRAEVEKVKLEVTPEADLVQV